MTPRSGTTYDWIQCPECGYPDPTVTRVIGDRGGTEAFEIDCRECDTIQQVTP